MSIRHFAVAALVGLSAAFSAAQATSPEKPQMVDQIYMDPVCPVPVGPMQTAPNVTRELRILYFPAAKNAVLKDLQSLTLYIGFNYPRSANNSATIPFARKDDHWEAVVPLDKFHAMYGIFYVKDEKTNVTDDHAGKLWDVMFCSPNGERNIGSIQFQAESYTGVSWPLGLHRERDYAQAVSIVEAFVTVDPRAQKTSMMRESLWNYTAERDGGDAKAWAHVADEIDKFVQSHLDERRSLHFAGNYIARHDDKFPTAFSDRLIAQIDALNKDSQHPLKAELMYTRAIRVRDPKQRILAIDEFIKTYPNVIEVCFALDSKFYDLAAQLDVPGAEATFAAAAKCKEAHSQEIGSSFNDHNLYLGLARLYIDKGIKLDEALHLADRAHDIVQSDSTKSGQMLPPQILNSVDAQVFSTKARAYIAMNKPQEAALQAQKAIDKSKSAQTYFVLAQALAAAGEKQKALDAYFEALLLPSNSDLKFATELQDYYIKQGFGDETQFQAELEKRKQERFKTAHYTPALTDKAAPAFEFTSLSGEKFPAAALAGKMTVINFWSPG